MLVLDDDRDVHERARELGRNAVERGADVLLEGLPVQTTAGSEQRGVGTSSRSGSMLRDAIPAR
jgi:hypothetical protein